MTDSGADEVVVAEAAVPAAVDYTGSGAPEGKQQQEQPDVKEEQGRPSPISILKAPKSTLEGATLTTPREPPTPTTSSSSTLGKRARSPQDLLSQLLKPNEEPSKKRKAYRVRWKSEAELEAIGFIERRAEGKKGHGETISEAEEGEVFKKAAPKAKRMLEWYQPVPVIIPFAYLQRIIVSEDAKVDIDVEEGALSDDDAAEQSPVETLRSLPPEQIGLLRETMTVYLPEEILYPNEAAELEYRQEREQQKLYQADSQAPYWAQPTSNQAQPGQEHEFWNHQQTGPSRGVDNGVDATRMAEHSYDRAEEEQASRRRLSATGVEAEYTSGYGSRADDGGSGEREREVKRRESNGGLSTINESTQAHHRHEEQYSLPVPKTQSISNLTKTSSAASWRGEPSNRSTPLNEHSKRSGDGNGKQRKADNDMVCKYYRTPNGCTRKMCSSQHL